MTTVFRQVGKIKSLREELKSTFLQNDHILLKMVKYEKSEGTLLEEARRRNGS